MPNTYYECHITLLCPRKAEEEETRTITENSGWSFSRIDGDIVEGAGVKCYATIHLKSSVPITDVISAVQVQAKKYLQKLVIREKVELVVYDTRSTKIKPSEI